MVVGVCASYDVFVHWDELWTVVFSKFRGSSNHTKQDKFKTDTDVIKGSDTSSESVVNHQVSQVSSTNKSTSINGMTTRLSNGSSKVKSGTSAQSKSQRRDIKNIKAGSMTILTAVFTRIGSL